MNEMEFQTNYDNIQWVFVNDASKELVITDPDNWE